MTDAAKTSLSLTAKQLQAAMLLAEDEIPDAQIAKRVGVSRSTLSAWKEIPAFVARQDEYIAARWERLKRHGIARPDRRMERQNAAWLDLQGVIAGRAAAARAVLAEIETYVAGSMARGADEAQARRLAAQHVGTIAPGMELGLVVRRETPTRTGEVIVEYALDPAPLAALLALEAAAEKSLGQAAPDRKDVTSGGRPLQAGPDLRGLSAERLALLEEILEEAESVHASEPPGG